jgi:hypothetical protein
MAPLADAGTAACVRAERAVSRALAGSCEVPLGAFAEIDRRPPAICAASSPRPTAAAWPARNCAAIRSRCRKRSARPWPTNCGRAARKRSSRRWADERLAWKTHRRNAAGGAGGQAGAGDRGARRQRRALSGAGDLRRRRPAGPAGGGAATSMRYRLRHFRQPECGGEGARRRSPRSAPWPERVVAAAMGETSARAIARFGVTRIVTPEGGRFDSEALLERPEFQPMRLFAASGWRFFAATAGRELLGETLEARGAQVDAHPLLSARPAGHRCGCRCAGCSRRGGRRADGDEQRGAAQPGGDGRRGGRGGPEGGAAVRRPPAHRRGGARPRLCRGRSSRRRATPACWRAWKRTLAAE